MKGGSYYCSTLGLAWAAMPTVCASCCILCCPQVAVRAIEIAKELHSGGKGAAAAAAALIPGNSTSSDTGSGSSGRSSSSGGSVIQAAEVKHDELVRQSQWRPNATRVVAPSPPDQKQAAADGAAGTAAAQ